MLSKKIKCNNINMHYLDSEGDKKPLLLLHALAGNSKSWLKVSHELEEDYRVIIPDLRGHGLTDKPNNGYDKETLCSDIISLLDSLSLLRVAIIGHSLGGKVAMILAAEYPDRISKIVVEEAHLKALPYIYQGWYEGVENNLGPYSIFQMIQNNFNSREAALSFKNENIGGSLTEWFGMSLVETNEGLNWNFSLDSMLAIAQNFMNEDLMNLSGKIMCPTLFLLGGKGAFSESEINEIKSCIRGSQSITINEAGHWMHGETPSKYLQSVIPFLKE